MLTAHQKSHLRRGLLGFAGFSLLALALGTTGALSQLETLSLDYRYQKAAPSRAPDDRVVVIDIDDESLKFFEPEFGAWPWPRSVYKRLLEYLSLGEPRAVLFDILFTERQKNTNNDQILREATLALPGTSHAIKFNLDPVVEGVQQVDPTSEMLKSALSLVAGSAPAPSLQTAFKDYLAPNTELMGGSVPMHAVNAWKDEDGIFRRGYLAVNYLNHWFPSISLKGVLAALKEPQVQVQGSLLEIRSEDHPPLKAELSSQGLIPYHFYPTNQPFKVYQIGPLLQAKDKIDRGLVEDPASLDPNPLEAFKGKIILIGASAIGLEDLKSTPIHKNWPGVLLHATTISNLLQQQFLNQRPLGFQWPLALLFVALVYFFVLGFEAFWVKGLAPLALLATYISFAVHQFSQNHTHWPLAAPVALAGLALLDAFVHMTFVEGRQRKQMVSTLSKFLPPEVAQSLAQSGIDPTAEVGRKQVISILFSDVRGFTTMSEKNPPEQVVRVLNRYLGSMTDEIFRHRGTLDKFIGDAIMCFWGAPTENPNHCRDAVQCALDMTQRLKELNTQFAAEGVEALKVGVGINTGPVIVGNIGSEKRLDYTVIGDNVNLASRLEGLTKAYGVQVLLGPDTYAGSKADFLCREVDWVIVKGKTEAVKIYEPLVSIQTATDKDQKRVQEFQRARDHYVQGDFREASKAFAALLQESPEDGLLEVYLERCKSLMAHPPKVWNGVFEATFK